MMDLSHFKDKKMAVLGLGKSGLSVARELKKLGISCQSWDDSEKARQKAADLGLELTDLMLCPFEAIDYLILSPGIPHNFPAPHPIVARAQKANVEIVSDIFLFKEGCLDLDIIAVTGTNGKSTTTALLYHVLKNCLSCQMGGNIGTALMDLDLRSKCDVVVAELSSYQTEITPNLNAKAVIWLNITPDHLDRYESMDKYVQAKARIFETKKDGGVAVICIDDAWSQAMFKSVQTNKKWTLIPVSTQQILDEGVSILEGRIFENGRPMGSMDQAVRLKGQHNHQNAACVYAVARNLYDMTSQEVQDLFGSFEGLAHRQFHNAHIGHVDYINDSKATNADASEKALRSYENIYWLAGGVAKEGGLAPLLPALGTVRKAYLYGESALDFYNFLKEHSVECQVFKQMDEAFQAAHQESQGDAQAATLLLSPACASFDQYSSFEKRGEHFEMLVAEFSKNYLNQSL